MEAERKVTQTLPGFQHIITGCLLNIFPPTLAREWVELSLDFSQQNDDIFALVLGEGLQNIKETKNIVSPYFVYAFLG